MWMLVYCYCMLPMSATSIVGGCCRVLEAYGSTDPETTVVKVRDVPELIATYCVCCCQPTWDVTLILARKPKA